jgi:hypothetical protein
MTYRVGDTVFLSKGDPAKVAGRSDAKGTVVLDRDFESTRQNTRHGLINGIDPARRQEFLGIMDAVKQHKEPEQRVEELQRKIDELQVDPKNLQFVKYLESEKNHIINVTGYRPRMFSTDDHRLR